MDLSDAVRGLGGIASGAELRSRGFGQDRLDRAVRAGTVVRARRGWFATSDADPDAVRAVSVGGTLSCVSALKSYGVWVMPFAHLHVRADPHRHATGGIDIRVHWWTARDTPLRGRDSVADSLDVAIQCVGTEAAIVALDSALEKRLVTRSDLAARFDGRRRHLDLLNRADGASQAGIESLVRIRLRSRGIRVRTQVIIAEVGRVDLLVGDRLIIETDGRMFHDDAEAFSRDRRRDLAAQSRGYLVVRLSYRQIMWEWPAVIRLLRLIRRDEHLWRVRQRAAAAQDGSQADRAR